ncbi:hypothetical protein [Budvicia aquatica]|uniref:Uncharacterized protein n=1 Tax=Budvicia aquatica TaxID=82979 RepID=A0A484ZKA0_9GAMM|nr:hypothetical protein [Budvicia aquatica]VFS46229.1 Uncharacterised protein [Budvicia aquatica]
MKKVWLVIICVVIAAGGYFFWSNNSAAPANAEANSNTAGVHRHLRILMVNNM